MKWRQALDMSAAQTRFCKNNKDFSSFFAKFAQE